MESVLREQIQFRDIIQGSFEDGYKTMTHKIIFALRFYSEYCSQAEYLIKTHDDVFVNGYNLFYQMILFREMKGRTPEKAMFGLVCSGYLVQCQVWEKWYTTTEEYPADILPDFCGGQGYIMTTELVKFLARKVITTKYFHADAIFIGLALHNVTDVMLYLMNSVIKAPVNPLVEVNYQATLELDFARYKNDIFLNLV